MYATETKSNQTIGHFCFGVNLIIILMFVFNLSEFYSPYISAGGETMIPKLIVAALCKLHENNSYMIFLALLAITFTICSKLLFKDSLVFSMVITVVELFVNIALFLIVCDFLNINYFSVRGIL
jgi:hypothetical protein